MTATAVLRWATWLASQVPIWLTRVESTSMEPTLHPGQLVLTTRLRWTTRVHRGALVAVDSPELGRRIVKRIVGLPGDHVRIRDGRVHVNGTSISEPYATRSAFNGVYQVPDGHYFLLGDNRDASSDSRSWVRPYLSRDRLQGRLHPIPAIRRGRCCHHGQ